LRTAALVTAAADPSIAAVASVAGFDFSAAAAACRAEPAERAAYVAAFGSDLLPLRGTSGEARVAEMEQAGQPWGLARLGPQLSFRPVLLIGTGADPVTPAATHHQPVLAAYQAHGAKLEHHVSRTDHARSDHRVALARVLVKFLGTQLTGPR
jgi:hypothetical protein